MMADEMTDAEAAAQVARTDAFIADFRELIAGTVIDLGSCALTSGVAGCSGSRRSRPGRLHRLCESREHQCGDARPVAGVIEVHLLAVGRGPTLDHVDATAFLAAFSR
jgi:coenzyme F420-reducing hydrogenase gamma subunit